ncbi:MAG TPA: hypothetical protein VI452_13290 [Marmoricola sp.]
MPDPQHDEKQRLEIDWLKTAAGALAAVSSAVVLSTVGVAGTFIGAALGSVIFTLSSNLYSTGLDRSRRRVARAQALAAQKLGVAQAEVRRAARRRTSQTAVEGHLEHADEQLLEAQMELDALAEEDEGEQPSWPERLRALPWKRVALVALGLFVVAIVAITIFELIAGRPVSSFTGGTQDRSGTTFSDLGSGGPRKGPDTTPTPAPGQQHSGGNSTPGQVPTFQSTPTQAPSAPTQPTPTPSAPAPSSSPSTVPSTPAPTPTPQETTSPTAGAS